jgi:hypothetical protein
VEANGAGRRTKSSSGGSLLHHIPAFRRQGFATTAAVLAAAWGLEHLSVDAIVAIADEPNLPSRQVTVAAARRLAASRSWAGVAPCHAPNHLPSSCQVRRALFFLPESWTYERGVAIVVPERDAFRLDFSRADIPREQTC